MRKYRGRAQPLLFYVTPGLIGKRDRCVLDTVLTGHLLDLPPPSSFSSLRVRARGRVSVPSLEESIIDHPSLFLSSYVYLSILSSVPFSSARSRQFDSIEYISPL